jgi:hypothetical protein
MTGSTPQRPTGAALQVRTLTHAAWGIALSEMMPDVRVRGTTFFEPAH